jgi:UDP-N-acetylmuramoyl-tripeptide--D-alanyl-D-alanine ligase
MQDMQGLKNIKVVHAGKNWCASGVSTDTRKPVSNSLFFAIKGEHYDGHTFVNDALKSRAAGVVVDKNYEYRADAAGNKAAVFSVPDTVESLGELAHSIRERYKPTVITITGSNGKTTTKEMLYDLLSGLYDTGRTQGNLNNLIGLPMSILNMEQETRMWVLELGTSRYGELARLTGIASPDIGILTNIGRAHLEFFHDLEGVAKAKEEMFSAMKTNGTAVMNADDPLVMGIARRFQGRTLTAGFSADAQMRIVSYNLTGRGMDFSMRYEGEEHSFSTPVSGRHYLYDIALSMLCARHVNVDWDTIRAACGRFQVFRGRGNRMSYKNNITVLDDTYNANPDSMRSGFLSAIERYGAQSIVAVIGDMLELGDRTAQEHYALGKFLAEQGIGSFILIGRFSGDTLEGVLASGRKQVSAKQVEDIPSAVRELVSLSKDGVTIYVKGSRSMKLEQVIAAYDAVMRGGNA